MKCEAVINSREEKWLKEDTIMCSNLAEMTKTLYIDPTKNYDKTLLGD